MELYSNVSCCISRLHQPYNVQELSYTKNSILDKEIQLMCIFTLQRKLLLIYSKSNLLRLHENKYKRKLPTNILKLEHEDSECSTYK